MTPHKCMQNPDAGSNCVRDFRRKRVLINTYIINVVVRRMDIVIKVDMTGLMLNE